MPRAATKSSNNSSPHGAARPTDEPQVHFGPEPENSLYGESGNGEDIHTVSPEQFGFASGSDYSTIHADTFTHHVDHEGESSRKIHSEWIDFGSRSNLEAPPPRAGHDQRWIRCQIKGTPDLRNVKQKQLRRGWQPRHPSTIPQDEQFFPTMMHSSGPDCIYVDGNMLCERPSWIGVRERQAIAEKTKRLHRAVAETILGAESKNGARHNMQPLRMEERRRTSGGTKRPNVMRDESVLGDED